MVANSFNQKVKLINSNWIVSSYQEYKIIKLLFKAKLVLIGHQKKIIKFKLLYCRVRCNQIEIQMGLRSLKTNLTKRKSD
jgi:hypothetical protein